MYPRLPCYICFHTGKSNLKRNIPVQPVYNKLGHRRASPILCFHGQTGLDMSGRFAGRANEVFMASDEDILNALESLDHRDPSQEGYNQFERFICQIYTSKVYTKVNDFRWFLYSTNATEGRVFPNNNAYSMSTLRSNDLEKGWGKPSTPSFSGRL